MTDYIFEQGEAIALGSHGEHDYVFASGEKVPDTGTSTLVFESGTGLGGVSLVVGGTEVGFYETNESHADFWDYDPDAPDTEPFGSNAQGLESFGAYTEPSERNAYIIGHHSTVSDTWAIGMWGVWDSEDSNGDNTEGGNHKTTWNNLESIETDDPDSPTVKDGPESGNENDVYETEGGVPVAQHQYGSKAGDGVLYTISGGATITVDMAKTDDGRSFSNNIPSLSETDIDNWVGLGPLDSSYVTGGWGTSVTIEVTAP